MHDTNSISRPGQRFKTVRALALAAVVLAFAPWLASAPAQSPACAESDFNCDGNPDFLWRNYGSDYSGVNGVWFMQGVTYLSYADLPTQSDLNWYIGGSGDFNADGRPDIVWRNGATGSNVVWYMNGTARIGTVTLPSESDSTWRIKGVADFNSDGKPDLLWQKDPGDVRVWYLNGATLTDSPSLPNVTDTNWRVNAARDTDRDGKAEVIWRKDSSGENAVWFVNYDTVEATPNLPVATTYANIAASSAARSAKENTAAAGPLPSVSYSYSYTPLNRSATYGLVDNYETQGSNMMWLMD